MAEKTIALALHGGAGTITRKLMDPEKEKRYTAALEQALQLGYAALAAGKTSIEAVEATVISLEDCPLFNAGKGSVFTHEGRHEMDASIMEGKARMAGAVAGVQGIRNPIHLAKAVMEQSEHVMLSGKGAEEFAKSVGFEQLDASYFYDEFRHLQWQEALRSGTTQLDHTPLKEDKFGTVGAVALDVNGNLAAATSTGGMTNKKFGRVGDSPLIGLGTYANNKTCAVSCTGSGEFFIRGVVAYEVSALMEFGGLNLEDASAKVIHERLLEIGGDGGLVAVDSKGNLSLPFNTEGMYRAAKSNLGIHLVEIYKSSQPVK
ncbi:MAG: isoaspartyl peptidase/L-asparaginase [Vicingaceae bacterium]